jgi:hypothetical protein
VFKIIKQGKLSPDSSLKQLRAVIIPVASYTISGDIWIESLDKSIKERITTGELHNFVELSPDETKVLSALDVIDLKGHEISVGEKGVDTSSISESSIGTPQAKWSPDSRKIAYMRLTAKVLDPDGQDIQDIKGNIHVVNADGSGLQVIDIPGVILLNPIWSPDGTRIVCTGENTGKVYVIKLK